MPRSTRSLRNLRGGRGRDTRDKVGGQILSYAYIQPPLANSAKSDRET